MFNPQFPHSNVHSLAKKKVQTVILAMSLIFISPALHPQRAFAIPSKPDVVDHVTIQHTDNGFAASYTLPIYQVGDIRFLSTGVGIEERQTTYPPFPLKLIFAQTSGAFLTGVSVIIKDLAGKDILKISEDQTSGPWLFLDLLPGTYQVTAVREDGKAVKQTVKLPKGSTKDIYFHWPSP